MPHGGGTVDAGEAVETTLLCALADPVSDTTPASERRIPPTHETKKRLGRRDDLYRAFTTVPPPCGMPKWHSLSTANYFIYLTIGCQLYKVGNSFGDGISDRPVEMERQ